MSVIVDSSNGSGELVVVHAQINLLQHSSHLLLLAEELVQPLLGERHLHLSQLVTDTLTVHQLGSYLVLLRSSTDLRDLLLELPLHRSDGLLAREPLLHHLLLESCYLGLLCYQGGRLLATLFHCQQVLLRLRCIRCQLRLELLNGVLVLAKLVIYSLGIITHRLWHRLLFQYVVEASFLPLHRHGLLYRLFWHGRWRMEVDCGWRVMTKLVPLAVPGVVLLLACWTEEGLLIARLLG